MKDGLYEAATGCRLTIIMEQFREEDSYAGYGIDAGDEKRKETSKEREIESPAKEKSKKQK